MFPTSRKLGRPFHSLLKQKLGLNRYLPLSDNFLTRLVPLGTTQQVSTGKYDVIHLFETCGPVPHIYHERYYPFLGFFAHSTPSSTCMDHENQKHLSFGIVSYLRLYNHYLKLTTSEVFLGSWLLLSRKQHLLILRLLPLPISLSNHLTRY